jgi:hypothetical protein
MCSRKMYIALTSVSMPLSTPEVHSVLSRACGDRGQGRGPQRQRLSCLGEPAWPACVAIIVHAGM